MPLEVTRLPANAGFARANNLAVAAADESISGTEEHTIRQIASELSLTPRELADVRSAWRDKREILKGFDQPAHRSAQ